LFLKKKDGEKETSKVRIRKAHYVLSGVDEVLCGELAAKSVQRSEKGSAGLYRVTQKNVEDAVLSSPELRFTLERFLAGFTSDCEYFPMIDISKKNENKEIITKYMEKAAGGSIVQFETQAFNIIMYLMLKNRVQVAETAFEMSQYAKKASVDDFAILHAVKTVYTGELLKAMMKRTEDISNIARSIVKEKDDESTKDGSASDSGKKPKKQNSKKSGKDNKKSKDDSDSDDSSSVSSDSSHSSRGSSSSE